MFYDIIVSPLNEEKDKKAIEFCIAHPNFTGEALFHGPEFSFSFHFTYGGCYPGWVAETDTWYILWYFFPTKDESAKENVIQWEDLDPKVFNEHKASLMKAAINWLKGKKAQRKIYKIFLERFTNEKRTDPKKDATDQMTLLKKLIAAKEGEMLPVQEKFDKAKEVWNIYGCYASTHYAHIQYKSHKNEEKYKIAMKRYFYDPLHTAILTAARSTVFQNLLTTCYDFEGDKKTLLGKMTLLLYGYHIERGGNKPELIRLTRHDLHLLKVPQKEIRLLIHDLAVLLKEVVIIDDLTDDKEKNPQRSPLVIRFYIANLPTGGCSIQLEKMSDREKRILAGEVWS